MLISYKYTYYKYTDILLPKLNKCLRIYYICYTSLFYYTGYICLNNLYSLLKCSAFKISNFTHYVRWNLQYHTFILNRPMLMQPKRLKF